MKKMGKLIIAVVLINFIFLLNDISADVLDVCPSGCDYSSIQTAINNATDGDVILVNNGTYNENVVINKQNIIISGNGSILEPANGIGFVITNSSNITIEKFKINTTGLNAHGIWIGGTPNGYGNSSNIIIQNNVINIGGKSSGIYAEQVNPPHSKWKITKNTINAQNLGVNLELYDVNNALIDNNIFGQSGSVSLVYSSENSNVGTAIVSNNVFNGNQDPFFPGPFAGIIPTIWIESDFVNWDGNTKVNNILIQKNKFYNWLNSGILIGEDPLLGLCVDKCNNISDININYNDFFSGTGPAIKNDVDDKIFNATFNWWGSCDGPGPVGLGSGAGVSVNLSYQPWLGACISNKTQKPGCILEKDNVTLYANISSIVCIGDVIFSVYINGSWQNFTGIPGIGIGNYSFSINSSLLNTGEINWTVYVDDCYNHTTSNGIHSLYVNKRTQLNVTPLSPDGLNNWYVSEPIFSLTNPDAINLFYQWDSMGVINYTGSFGLENIPNSPPKESAGILDLNYWSNVCNESEQTQIFHVDLTNPQIIDLTPGDNEIVYNNLRPEISAYLDEVYQSNSGIDTEIVQMSLNGIAVPADIKKADSLDAKISYIPNSDLSLGWNNVSVNVSDNAGRGNYTFWRFYTNLTNLFNLTVYFPENKNYSEKKIPFNITTTEEAEKIEFINHNDKKPKWKKLCSDCDNYGNKKKKDQTMNEDWNNITIRAVDRYGQFREKNISLFIDSKIPDIKKILPKRNSVVNGSEFYLKYTEDNLKEISINWNPSLVLANCNASGKDKECFASLNLSDYNGNYIDFWFNITDIVRSVLSDIVRIKIDTVSPKLIVYSPKNKTGNGGYEKKVPFNITVSEDVLLEYIDNNDENPSWRRLCSNCKEYGNLKKKTKSFKEAIHEIEIRAVDDAGNSDVERIEFEVE